MLQATDPRCTILLWLFLISFASSSSSAPAPPGSRTSPTNDPVPTYYRTTRADWSAQDVDPNDCGMAMTRFFVDDLLIHGDTSYEFLSNGVHSRSQFPVRHIPRKYAYGTCTMAVVMVTNFYPGDVPGLDLSRLYPHSDVSSYQHMWTAAQSAFHRCLVSRQMGWSAVGLRDAIGVFLWATDSEANQRVHAVNVPAGSSPIFSGPTSYNGTS